VSSSTSRSTPAFSCALELPTRCGWSPTQPRSADADKNLRKHVGFSAEIVGCACLRSRPFVLRLSVAKKTIHRVGYARALVSITSEFSVTAA
jgi:hypothetical protein